MNSIQIFRELCKVVQQNELDKSRKFLATLFQITSDDRFIELLDKDLILSTIETLEANEKLIAQSNYCLILGFLYKCIHNDEKAYENLTSAIARDNNDYIAYHLRSKINEFANKSFIDDAKEAVILYPNARTYYGLGEAYRRNGDYISNYKYDGSFVRREKIPRSIHYYRKAIKINNNFDYAYYAIAKVYLNNSRQNLAIEELKICIEISPTNHIYYLEIAKVLHKSEWRSDNEAIYFLKRGLELCGETAEMYLYLGEVYFYKFNSVHYSSEKFNLDKAIYYYSKYLENISIKEEVKAITRLQREQLINIATANQIAGNYVKSAEIFEELVSEYEEQEWGLEYEDRKLTANYYKSLLLAKHKHTKLDFDNPKYEWLENDKDASNFRRSKYEIYKGAKVMEIVNSVEDRETQFSFGKYKGVHLKKVVEKDLNYIKWCYDNIPSFFIVDLIRIDKKLRRLKDYYKFLEIHLIKADYLFQIFDEEEQDYHTEHLSLGDVLGREEAGIAYWNTH